jgi:replicative DNA helicase
MLDPEAISRVSDRLIPEAFYISAHKDIYQAVQRLHCSGKPTDLLTVTAWLTDHDLLVRIGGRNKLATLVDRTVSAVNIDTLAELVMDKFARRQLIKAGNEIVHLGYETETELPQILDQSEQKIFQLSNQTLSSNTEHNSTINVAAYEDLNSGNPIYPTGLHELDNLMVGFDKRPMMSDLSQSGILEMVADNIILAYRDEYYNPDTTEQGILELIMAKARHGETGTATVFFDKSYGIIQNLRSGNI